MKSIEERLNEHYQDLLERIPEDRIFFIALQGSQNYDMADEDSDVDSKAVVIPSLDDIIFNKDALSYTFVRDNDEHIDIKDIRLMFKQYRKQNINFVETLFSKYVIVNPKYKRYWDILQTFRELIAHYDMEQSMKTMCGMCSEKYHALTHRYPSREYWLDKYGYDPKQLSHLMRVYEFMKNYAQGSTYEKCLIPENTEYLRKVKRGEANISLEDALILGKEYLDAAVNLKNDFIENSENYKVKEVDEVLDDIQAEIIKEFLRDELRKN